MKVLYADLSEHVAEKLEMPDDVKYVEHSATLTDDRLRMHNGDVLYIGKRQLKGDAEIKLTKLDSRYYLEYGKKNEILYDWTFVPKNKEVSDAVAPYSKFISEYFDHDDIYFCNRCKFGIFNYLFEDNHGGFYYDCDVGREACLAPVLQEFDVQCEWCDRKLCGACERNVFDSENVGFNILLSAVVLFDAINCEYEEFVQLMDDFPSEEKYVQKLITYITGHMTFEDIQERWRSIYAVNEYDYDFSNVIEFLRKYQKN